MCRRPCPRDRQPRRRAPSDRRGHPARSSRCCAPPPAHRRATHPRTAPVRWRRRGGRARRGERSRRALRIFQRAQFLAEADADIAVGADSETPAGAEPAHAVEDAVTPSEDSVIGQSPATAPVAASARVSSGSICVQWIRHQRASTGIVARKMSHGPCAVMGEYLLDLADLLGQMHVHRPVIQAGQGGQRFRRHPRAGCAARDRGAYLREALTAPCARLRRGGYSDRDRCPKRICPGPSGRPSQPPCW